jgi:predicted TPR repeat methyltransferase
MDYGRREKERQKYDLYVSQYVIAECSLGDPDAARRRVELIRGITVLPNLGDLDKFVSIYQKLLNIPERAKIDCSYLAACVVNEVDYLFT